MKERMWNSDAEHPDRMERRMAECLVHGTVPWEAIQFVGVDEVNAIREGAQHVPGVGIRRGWYFRGMLEVK